MVCIQTSPQVITLFQSLSEFQAISLAPGPYSDKKKDNAKYCLIYLLIYSFLGNLSNSYTTNNYAVNKTGQQNMIIDETDFQNDVHRKNERNTNRGFLITSDDIVAGWGYYD